MADFVKCTNPRCDYLKIPNRQMWRIAKHCHPIKEEQQSAVIARWRGGKFERYTP